MFANCYESSSGSYARATAKVVVNANPSKTTTLISNYYETSKNFKISRG
jgi:hypothetical protein